jgi:hypothetical protein
LLRRHAIRACKGPLPRHCTRVVCEGTRCPVTAHIATCEDRLPRRCTHMYIIYVWEGMLPCCCTHNMSVCKATLSCHRTQHGCV